MLDTNPLSHGICNEGSSTSIRETSADSHDEEIAMNPNLVYMYGRDTECDDDIMMNPNQVYGKGTNIYELEIEP